MIFQEPIITDLADVPAWLSLKCDAVAAEATDTSQDLAAKPVNLNIKSQIASLKSATAPQHTASSKINSSFIDEFLNK